MVSGFCRISVLNIILYLDINVNTGRKRTIYIQAITLSSRLLAKGKNIRKKISVKFNWILLQFNTTVFLKPQASQAHVSRKCPFLACFVTTVKKESHDGNNSDGKADHAETQIADCRLCRPRFVRWRISIVTTRETLTN